MPGENFVTFMFFFFLFAVFVLASQYVWDTRKESVVLLHQLLLHFNIFKCGHPGKNNTGPKFEWPLNKEGNRIVVYIESCFCHKNDMGFSWQLHHVSYSTEKCGWLWSFLPTILCITKVWKYGSSYTTVLKLVILVIVH